MNSKVKQILKEMSIGLLIGGIIALIFMYPFFPYYIVTPGGADEVSSYIDVEEGYTGTGDFYLTYVFVKKLSIFDYLTSRVNNNYEIRTVESVESGVENSDEKEFRDHMYTTQSVDEAIMNVYNYLNLDYTITSSNDYFVYLDTYLDTKIKVGDELITYDGNDYINIDAVQEYVQNLKVGDTVTFEVGRDKEVFTEELIVFESGERKVLGFSILTDYTMITSPHVEIDMGSLGGPSAGLMMSLSLYNQLVPNDITSGKKICGTGTIDKYGTVGPIGSAKFKVLSSEKEGCEIFFAPNDNSNDSNYLEVLAQKEAKNLTIEVVPVERFEDAIIYLESLN